MKTSFIVTCEHAGFEVPKFIDPSHLSKSLLKSHVGWDQGAHTLAQSIASQLKAQYFHFDVTRLIIDSNRRIDNGAMGRYPIEISPSQRARLEKTYHAYRIKVQRSLQKLARAKQKVFVFSVHSFVPLWKGQVRSTDIGLLFRPKLEKELALAKLIRKGLAQQIPSHQIHFNRPYRGHTDCFLNDLLDNHLRDKNVNGLFLEFNQRILTTPSKTKKIGDAIASVLNEFKILN